MHALQHCQCEVTTVRSDAAVPMLADLMDRHSIGCVVVVDDAGAPLGIVTDRDLVSRVVAADRDAEKTTVGEVMSRNVVAVDAGEPLARVLDLMRQHAVRRVPVLENGRVTGIASSDDILFAIATDVWNLAEAVRIELRDAQGTVRRRRWDEQRRESLERIGSQARDLARSVQSLVGGELERLRRRR